MTHDEALSIIRRLRGLFAGRPQPTWNDPGVMPAWTETLLPFSMLDASNAVERLTERCQTQIDKGDPIYFPSPIDFGNDLRKVATEAEREAYQRDALVSAIHCDGSRWIDNMPDALGNRPFPSKGDGLVACPTCSPSVHKRQMGGNQHEPTPRGEQKSPPPCRRDYEDFAGPTMAGRAEIERAKAMLVPTDSRAPRRVFRSTRDLDEPEADTTVQPTDAALRCPWCGGSVTRTKLAQWWRCENGEMSTMRQILAGGRSPV